MENPRSAVHITVNASFSYNSKNGAQKFRICLTRAHRGISDLPHGIHLPSTPSVLGSPQATLPACCLKIFFHSAFKDLQKAPLPSQVMPAAPAPSLGVLCPSSVRKKLPNRGLAMVCASPAPPRHAGPQQDTAVSRETTAGTSWTWGQVWHKDLLRKLWIPSGAVTPPDTPQSEHARGCSEHRCDLGSRKSCGCRKCHQLQTLLCPTWSCRSTLGWPWLWAGWCS